MAKGRSGSFRANSLTASDLSAMQNHELRLDLAGNRRSIRKTADGSAVPPLIHNPLEVETLTQAFAVHLEGAKVNKSAGKICRHAFVQFPTDLPITPENERMMLNQAVAFVNGTHGGNAVFWARLDRDEAGRHGVDVFYAPKYQKITKRGATTWVSLTKFGKLRAVERFGEKPLERKNPETNVFEPVQDEHGNPVIVQCDSKFYQGRAFQDLWFEHLHDVVGLDWIVRGDHKVGRDPDRLEVEEYKLEQERQRLEAERTAEIAERRERLRLVEKAANQAINARTDLLRGAQENAGKIITKAEKDAARLVLEASQGLQRQQDVIDRMRYDLEAREKALKVEAEQQMADLSGQVECINKAINNLSNATRLADEGRHDQEITAADMADQPRKFEILCEAAPDGKPTWGFRCRFWSLNYSDGSGPLPEKLLPVKLREALIKAFDRVTAWSASLRKQRIEAEDSVKAILAAAKAKAEATSQRIKEEAMASAQDQLAGSEREANRILGEARHRAGEVILADRQLRAYSTLLELLKDKMRDVLGTDGYQKIAEQVNAVWQTHPENVGRPAERPRPYFSGPSEP